ncbi:MAG TPA: hypothetical protein VFH78_11050 [Candidatus Thermoplasmatota archaeon]|nr:hypothetical protein [Candidatus Thermoplasmatota archaeon]
MLRPVLAFLTLCLAAFLLAPTVASVHEKVEDLNFQRETPFHLWRWSHDDPPTLPFPNCGGSPKHLYSEITHWPTRIRKDEPFELRGVVQSEEDGRLGVGTIRVDVFLNETKSKPGVFLGEAESDPSGTFRLTTSIPFDLQAQHYHIVAHAKQKRINCVDYLEHWSDPEVDVLAKSIVVLDPPQRPVVGREVELNGRLIDSVGGPVRNATVNVTLDNERLSFTTDDQGAFRHRYVPERSGNVTWAAEYKGSRFYDPSKNETKFFVADEDLVVPQPIALLRSAPNTLTGQVYVADAARQDSVTLRLVGFNATACEGCPANGTFTLPLDANGAFSVTFTVPPTVPAGGYAIAVSGGGLKKTYEYDVTLDAPSVLAVEGDGTGLFSRGWDVRVVLTDETGAPLAGREVVVTTPTGTVTNVTGPDGSVALSGTSECGARTAHASFAGADGVRGSRAQDDLYVCGALAFIPPWLLAVPWWVWPLVALGAFVAWQVLRGWRQRYAPLITGGPTLTLVFTEPSDEAAGYAGVGEAVVASAFLEEPLPDGHRLRMGAHRQTAEVPLDAELRAHWRVVPDKLGDVHIRAEIVDPKGRVVSRRTLTLHVVRYAEEIERRYLALRHKHGQSESVTPREFERWLHEQAPGLDPDVVRRLVRVFEEADYSPRVAGRAEFAAYLAAEGGVKEVTADARLA